MANSRAQDNRSTEPQFIYPEFWARAQADDLWILQFLAIGKAVYYQTASPKLEVTHIEKDLDRDIVSAYFELYGCDRDTCQAPDPQDPPETEETLP